MAKNEILFYLRLLSIGSRLPDSEERVNDIAQRLEAIMASRERSALVRGFDEGRRFSMQPNEGIESVNPAPQEGDSGIN